MKAPGGPKPYALRLYVAGKSPHSTRAVNNLRRVCERHLEVDPGFEVVDLLRDPGRALEDGILVTPTLVRLGQGPAQTLLGDLSEESAVLEFLGVERGAS